MDLKNSYEVGGEGALFLKLLSNWVFKDFSYRLVSIVARFLRTKLEKILLRAEGTAGASEAHDAIYLRKRSVQNHFFFFSWTSKSPKSASAEGASRTE